MTMPETTTTATALHATGPTKHARAAYQPARTRLRRAAPSLDVVAAAEYLLTQPDAYLYRRRYLDLITQTPRARRNIDHRLRRS